MKSIHLPSVMTAHSSTNCTSEYSGDYSVLGSKMDVPRYKRSPLVNQMPVGTSSPYYIGRRDTP
jgi:hypothetical protein